MPAMTRGFHFLPSALLTLSLATPSLALNTKQIFQDAHKSVVLVMSFDEHNQPLAIGSGFFVGNGGAVATNFHVIEGAADVRVKTPDGDVSRIQNVLGVNLKRDLALLEHPESGKPLTLSKRLPEVGEEIAAIGNPKGLEGTLSNGIISGLREDEDDVVYQITAPISPGSSGGPILDKHGNVLGVSTFYVSGGQNLNFAVPAGYVQNLLDSPKTAALSETTGKKSHQKSAYADERVYAHETEILTTAGIYGRLEGSLINKTDHIIQNIRMVAIFYKTSNHPLHFMLINLEDTIAPGLGLRFQERDDRLDNHGEDATFGNSDRDPWKVSVKVLDYDIVDSGNQRIPVFE